MDRTKSCHIIIHVLRHEKTFIYSCLDCMDTRTYPLEMLDSVRDCLKGRDDGQVLLWIEDNG